MEDKIPEDIYKDIEKKIASNESVVGIDAKETHILILYKLMNIEKRLQALENQMASMHKSG